MNGTVKVAHPCRFAVVGYPVAHSLSPTLHRAAMRFLGLEGTYEAIEVPREEDLRATVESMREGRFDGLNVTSPHKVNALLAADDADESASSVGAANTLKRSSDGRVRAYNTDVEALGAELQALGARLAEGVSLVLGAGGAAQAALAALRRLGARRIAMTSRSWADPSLLSAADGSSLGADVLRLPWPEGTADLARAEWSDVWPSVTLVVQATRAGMSGVGGGEELAARVPWGRLPQDAKAYDLIYRPSDTAFLRAARQAGLEAKGGLGMLVRQAALALALWSEARLKRPFPRVDVQQVMSEAAAAALGGLA